MYVPMHLGSLMRIVPAILDRHRDDIREDDVFIANDPHLGGSTQLAEMVLAKPVFHEGDLVCWVANVAHHSDFVDRHHAHIFQEGLLIPPLHLHRRGELQTPVLDLILANCQVPSERVGDLEAQIASLRLGDSRVAVLHRRFSRSVVESVEREILNYAERQMREGIRAIPDGAYASSIPISDGTDSPGEASTTIAVTITIEGSDAVLDFSESPPQTRSGINAVRAALLSSVGYTMKAIACPNAWPNAGLFRPLRVISTPGTVVDCTSPAAVDDRTMTCQRLVELIIDALGPALPTRIMASSGDNSTVFISGEDPRSNSYYVLLDVPAGGSGARADKDGMDGVQVHLTNTSNLPIEALEQEYPLVVERYELVCDSGGEGKFRGGLGVHRRIRVVGHEAVVHVRDARGQTAAPGLVGGESGRCAEHIVSGRRHVGRLNARIPAGEAFSVITAGGGGYGPPEERDAALVDRDVLEGKVSPEAAKRVYGPTDPHTEDGTI